MHGGESPRCIEAKAADVRKVLIEDGLSLANPNTSQPWLASSGLKPGLLLHRHIETVTREAIDVPSAPDPSLLDLVQPFRGPLCRSLQRDAWPERPGRNSVQVPQLPSPDL